MLGEDVGGYSPSGGAVEPRCCESAGQPAVHVPRFHRITLSRERRKFPQQGRIASAARSVAVIRIEPAGFSGRSVMAIEPSLDLLKARAYRLKQAFGGLR
jgi:hypothetical protein